MSKTSFDTFTRHALNGATMGTRWQLLFWSDDTPEPVRAAATEAVQRVDDQMSLWKPESDLCRLNRAPVGKWVSLSPEITEVLEMAVDISTRSGGAFDITVGDAVRAWGFGPSPANPVAIQTALDKADRQPVADVLEVDLTNQRARKHAEVQLDLNGIAKGYGTDKLVQAARACGVTGLLAAIDGELRAIGQKPDGTDWAVAIEAPDYDARSAHSIIEISDLAVATSGDYRHWVEVGGNRLSHTMNPMVGAPLIAPPASVTVLADTCAKADAWATALMVLGPEAGKYIISAEGLEALFLQRMPDGTTRTTWARDD